MRRFAVLSALCFLVAAAPTASAMPGFEAGARGIYWFPDLSAQVQTFDPPPTGTKLDAKNDLGIGDENFLSGEAFLRIGRFHLRAGYTPISYDGSSTLTRTIVFNGQTFPVADHVTSKLDVELIEADLQVDILRPDLVAASFSLGLIGKVMYVDGEAQVQSSTLTERKDFQVVTPLVGLAAGAGFLENIVRVDARASGMAYSGNHVYEGDAFLSVIPFPFLRIQGGYRIIDLKGDVDEILVEMRLSGPYAGAQLSF